MTARLIRASLILACAVHVFADNPAIVVNVDANANRHAIDPRIYGAAWASNAEITTLGLTLNRWGGNAMSRYNWSNDTANRCKDYYFFNIHNGGVNGASADTFINNTFAAGAQPVMTIPMLSLLPEDSSKQCSFPIGLYPNQQEFHTDEGITCGNGRYANGDRILGNADPNNISTPYELPHQGDWIQHMIDTHGSSATGGVKYYSLDNEPGLWSFDHWDVHPDGTTYDEAWAKMSELGAIIREKDPGALITGGEEWGWSGYFQSGLDMENGDGGDAAAHGDTPWYDWMLDQFQQYEIDNGERILDVLTVHFYPQGEGVFTDWDDSEPTQLLRNRSTRALWDPDYTDESWMSCCYGGKVQLIPRLKEWVTNHYPGTQIGITEYNWGDVDHINAGTTQADILGIFGREGLDMAVRWESPEVGSFVGNAFRIYRNYDGAHSTFGETSVSAAGPDPDEVSVFAGQRTSDGALTVMLIAKVLTGDTPATVNLANFAPGSAIQRYELKSTNVINHLANLAPSGTSISLTLPPQSVTLLIVPPATLPDPPTLTATATSTSQVALSWTAVAGAINYEIQRSFNNSGFSTLTTIGTTSHNDMGLTADTAYLYKVRAIFAEGPGSFSTIDPATTTIFTDSPLTSGTPVKIAHIAQLRTAVNAMRASAGLTAQVFADNPLTISTKVKTTHVTQLRTALDQARAAIGLVPPLTYTDTTLTVDVTAIKAVHVNDLRNGMK